MCHGFRSKKGLLPVMLKGIPMACLNPSPNSFRSRHDFPMENITRLSTWKLAATAAAEQAAIPRSMELKLQTPFLFFNASQVGFPQKPQSRPAGFDATPITTMTGDARMLSASRAKKGRFSERAISFILSIRCCLAISSLMATTWMLSTPRVLGAVPCCGRHQGGHLVGSLLLEFR